MLHKQSCKFETCMKALILNTQILQCVHGVTQQKTLDQPQYKASQLLCSATLQKTLDQPKYKASQLLYSETVQKNPRLCSLATCTRYNFLERHHVPK